VIDLRLAVRSLLSAPLVTLVAALSLALGIGATAAIFSLYEVVLLRPLPVEEPDRLVNLMGPGPKSGSISSNNAGGMEAVFSYPMFRDLERHPGPFSGIAAHRSFGANLAYQGDTRSSQGLMVSGRYFEVLGARPELGRLIGPEDDAAPGAGMVAVLVYDAWRKRFDADPGVLNRQIVVNGQSLTIVGVGPRGFRGTTLGQDPEVFVPLSLRGAMSPGWNGYENRRDYWAYLFARLAPGMSLEQATTAINVAYSALVQEVEAPLQQGMSQETLERFKAKELTLVPGIRGQSSVGDEADGPLTQLFAVTGLVLLIACANVSNLLLTRGANRAGEMAVRLSIGARRRQLLAQLLTESFMLAAAGGLLGLLVAHGTLRLIRSLLPAEAVRGLDLSIGPAVWLFLAALSLLVGLVGLVPALHSTRTDLVHSLRGLGGTATRSRAAGGFRATMATLQVALSMTLLISAGLFTRSLYNISRVDLGIDTEQLLTFGLSPELNGYTPAQSLELFARVEDELRSVPGASLVTASMVPLISGNNWGSSVSVEGFAADPDTDTHSMYNEIGPDYFRTLGIPLIAGREIEARDAAGAPKVAVVNEAFARKFGLGRDAVGKRMSTSVGSGTELDIEIVGLVQDAKYSAVKDEVPALFFLPYRQNERLGANNFYVRSSGEPESLLSTVRGRVQALDPNLPIEDLRPMALQVRESVFLDRLLSTFSAAFAILATVLAAVGLYGVVAYRVAQRTREIGLRMALGADSGSVKGLVLRQVALLAGVGAILGTAGALGLGKLAGSLLYGMEANDPAVFATATVLLLAVIFLAGMVPAARAARIEPMRALRNQ
jgi:predicted permease